MNKLIGFLIHVHEAAMDIRLLPRLITLVVVAGVLALAGYAKAEKRAAAGIVLGISFGLALLGLGSYLGWSGTSLQRWGYLLNLVAIGMLVAGLRYLKGSRFDFGRVLGLGAAVLASPAPFWLGADNATLNDDNWQFLVDGGAAFAWVGGIIVPLLLLPAVVFGVGLLIRVRRQRRLKQKAKQAS